MYKGSIKHIFFDLDHTLWDFDRNSLLAYERIFEEFNINVPMVEFLEIYAPINLRYWKLYREQQIDTISLRRGRLIDTFAIFSLNFPSATIDIIADKYIQYLPLNSYLLDGALELLEYLTPSYSLHIITNGFREVQARKLETSRIAHFFETVTDSEVAGVKKPDQLIFEFALNAAGANKTESLMIGDNFEADILGAHDMGLKTIYFNYHKEEISNKFRQVTDLNDIKQYL